MTTRNSNSTNKLISVRHSEHGVISSTCSKKVLYLGLLWRREGAGQQLSAYMHWAGHALRL